MPLNVDGSISRIAFVGNYVPRRCGIATFTTDVCTAVANHSRECIAVAINDRPEGYDYPSRVQFTIDQNDVATYRRAAQFLNIRGADIVSVQHEFGIFGGAAGSHILALLRELRTPIVATLHTVLKDPAPDQHRVLRQLAALSDRVIVMSRRGETFLRDVYDIPGEKVDFIHHGIPDMPFADPNFHKDEFGTAGKFVLMTFGLLSPGKGLENAIRALPRIRAHVPNAVYQVVGATHPNLVREQGEAYRESLSRLARELGVEDALLFHNDFVEADELVDFIGTADIYVTPYLNEAQITSGSLAWAVGAGRPVISTPYWHAQELLADERGVLVPFNDPDAIASAAIELFENDARRNAIRKRAYLFGRTMIWSYVGRQYLESFERAHSERAERPRTVLHVSSANRPRELPSVQLRHLLRMTDNTGLLQHAIAGVPNYDEGYSLDDNARALILMIRLQELGELVTNEIDDLAARYFAFVLHAFNAKTGRFRNFMACEGQRWLEESGSDDCHGRTVWALGVVASQARQRELRDLAGKVLGRALPAACKLAHPRSWAFVLLGLHEYLSWFSGDRAAQAARAQLASRLLDWFRHAPADDWPWFEDRLTYCNARVPHALLVTGEALADEEMMRVGLRSLKWLVDIQHAETNHLVPIGSNGFYPRGGHRARFDQQPIEANVTVSACLEAYRLTGETDWYREARRAFEWFLGRNDLGVPLCDPRTGACCDGLRPESLNVNQGAESTLAYLLSLAEMRLAERDLPTASELHVAEQPSRNAIAPAPEQSAAYRGRLALPDQYGL